MGEAAVRVETVPEAAVNNPVAAYARFEDDHWWFVARRTILRRMVTQLMEPSADRLVVDVGCGPGGNIASLAGMYRCVGVDSSEDGIALARRRFPTLEFVCGVAPQALGGREREADLWLLMDVLEHVDEDRELLHGIVAHAKPGAYFFITVPADPDLWSPHDDAAGHRRRYTRATLSELWRDLPVRERLVSGYNARLYWVVKAMRRVTALLNRSHGGAEAEGLDLDIPPAPFNGILTGLFSNEAVRLCDALEQGTRGFPRGVSLLAVLERLPGEVPLGASAIPTSALTSRELGGVRRRRPVISGPS